MLDKIKKVLKKPDVVINYIFTKACSKYMSDEMYLKIKYKLLIGKYLNLENPITYNEKLQWLKLNDRNPLYTKLADKYEVRQYIKEKIGEEHLIPLLGVYDTFDEIDFDSLPNEFVLKTTHDSGGVVICRDKNKFNVDEAKKKLNKSLNRNYYNSGREWQYKDIKPRIICEKYMVDESNVELKDYKFFCFHGEVKALYIATERAIKPKFDFFDINFNHMPFRQGYDNSSKIICKPKAFDEMIELSRKLSEDFPHIRIDLYDINGKIYFGEFTFHHMSGLSKFEPEEFDKLFGSWIDLRKVNDNVEVNL